MSEKKQDLPVPTNLSQLIFTSLGFAVVMLVFIIYYFNIGYERTLVPIKLATGEWAPYTGEALAENGIATAIITRVLQDIGYEPDYHFMPFPLAEARAAEGETDDDIQGAFPYMENVHRNNRFYFSETIITIDFALFYNRRNNPKGAEIYRAEDLANYIVVAIDGYEYPPEIAPYISLDYPIMGDNLAAFHELEKSDQPLIVAEAFEVGEQILDQRMPRLVSDIRPAPLRIESHNKLMLSKRNPENLSLLREFNAQLRYLQQDQNAFNALQRNVKNQIDRARAVMLEPFENNVIHAYKSKQKKEVILLPKGSRAIVKEWDMSYLSFHAVTDAQSSNLVRIKLLNGPFALKDSLLYVDGRSIRLQQ